MLRTVTCFAQDTLAWEGDAGVCRWRVGQACKRSLSLSRMEAEYFFSQQAIRLWNSWPQDVVLASGLGASNRGLDRGVDEKSMQRLEVGLPSEERRPHPDPFAL